MRIRLGARPENSVTAISLGVSSRKSFVGGGGEGRAFKKPAFPAGFLAAVGTTVLMALVIVGCPEPPPAPFDTTGTYTGTWSGHTNEVEKQQVVAACPLTITLQQDVSLAYPANHGVTGTVDIDYSCLVLPEWMDEIPPSQAQVSGILADDGTLTLLSGGCGTGLCLVMALSGAGVDSNSDGGMDEYGGAWSFTILLAGVQPFGVSGQFEVTSVD